jgi:hypothetical protein
MSRVVPDFGTRWGCGVDRADGQTGSDEGLEGRERKRETETERRKDKKRDKGRNSLEQARAESKRECFTRLGYPKDKEKKKEESGGRPSIRSSELLFTVLPQY